MCAARPIYIDYQATTPVDTRVMDVMTPFFTEIFGNPHSTSHSYGWEARGAVEAARVQVAGMINADPREVIFTSGATESNNMAIKGVGRFFTGRKGHMIAPVTEHKCVLESLKYVEKLGYEITLLPVGADGLLDPAAVKDAIRDDTALVSVMHVNNEIGVIQPMAEIGAICRERDVYLHSDAAQAAGKTSIDVAVMNIDLLSLSSHKMYGPMGVGVLYVRRKPRVRLEPLMDGGGQERTLRSGTLPAPLVVGMGKAAEIITNETDADHMRIRDLRDRLMKGLQQRVPGTFINGSLDHRIAGNLNIGFEGIDSEALMGAVKDQIALSSGSACTSAAVEPSYVLRALGLSDTDAYASVRMCVGRMTTSDEIDTAIAAISVAVTALRETDESRLRVQTA
jgi:cysteine desulfurase